jgi:hypothetical protein
MDYQEAHFFLYTQNEIKKQELREQMEVMRLQTFYMLKPHLKDSINKPSKLMPFHWESEPILDVQAVDFDAFDKLFQKRLLKKKNKE